MRDANGRFVRQVDKVYTVCQVCALPFAHWPSSKRKYCSFRCSLIGRKRSRKGFVVGEHYEVPLATRGTVIVDIVDADLENEPWSNSSGGYARTTRNYKLVLMHRVVLERKIGRPLARGEEVDHANGNGLDNRRVNLRVATRAQNQHNRPKHRDSRSTYKGVYRSKSGNYEVVVYCQRTKINVGTFPDELYAAYMHDQFAIALQGEFARTNVI